ncbi:MAG: transposase [Bacteroidetes bacterium]|nr:transposase [Bacteroidota bacterium]
MELILGASRLRWARGENLAAVAETFSPGMTVTATARERGINRSMLFAWRKKFRAEAGFPATSRAPSFVPVTVRPDPVGFSGASPAAGTGLGTIEISFTHAPQIRITGGVDPEIPTALISFAGIFYELPLMNQRPQRYKSNHPTNERFPHLHLTRIKTVTLGL